MTTPSVREAVLQAEQAIELHDATYLVTATGSSKYFAFGYCPTMPVETIRVLKQAAAEREAMGVENAKIRKILSFIPARIVIEAKEKAGYGDNVK